VIVNKEKAPMNFPVRLLWINAVLFVLFGVGFIVAPRSLSLLITGATPGTASAMIDIRATYGGMALGTGLFFGFCAYHHTLLRAGLLSSLLTLSGIAGGRLIGIFADGSPNGWMFLLLAAELLFVGLMAVALKQVSDA
jgi:hypothetical protein